MSTQTNINKSNINAMDNKRIFIKKVILENFLSFQKDEVDFDKSKFVIIVGPNWSGKTSIFQAIKFALGSNERDERYKKWSSFIRNGQNHAMVEIQIQIDDSIINVRRYVIRGQSPFFKIKKMYDKEFKKASVQEIQKLISNLNINPDNQFAFVSQGKIDAIKNLKPTELCSFLEEGIGLKGLREEILQQKSDVLNLNKDLQSLKSKRNTLNISLELLNPKLERLKQKNELLNKKNKFNDELLWANKDKLEKDIVTIEETIKNVKLVIESIRKKKELSDREIELLSNKILKKEQQINKLSEKVGECTYKQKELFSIIQNWQKDKILAKQKLDELSRKINEYSKILDNFQKQKESLDNEIKSVRKESKIIGLEIDKLITEQNQLVKKISKNKALLDKYNLFNFEKKDRLARIQENEKSIQALNSEINQLFQSFKDIEHKLEKNKWFLENPSRNLLIELDKDLRSATLRIYEIESELNQLEANKSKKIKKLKILQASLRERRVILPPNISILKDEIEKRGLKVKGPLINYLKYDDELSYAIESVLGEKLLYSFVAKDWDTLNLLKRLKEKYGAYCNIYLPKNTEIKPMIKINADGVLGYLVKLIEIIDDDIDIKKVIYSKVKNCLVVKDYHSGRNLYNSLNFKGKCVTLKGEQIISYRYVYETPYLKRLKGLLSAGTQKEQSEVLEFEIESLNNEMSELKEEQATIDTNQKEIFKKKESFNDLLYNFNQKQRITSKKNQLYDQMHELEKINQSLKNEIIDFEHQIKNLKSQTDPEFFKWNDRVEEIPKELALLNEDKKKWDLKLNENSDILKEVKDNLNKNSYEKYLIQKEYDTKKEAFQKADNTAFNTYRQLENIEEELEITKKKISELKNESLLIQNKKAEIERESIQITITFEQENIKLNSLNQDLDSKKNDLERIRSEIGPLILKDIIKIRPIEDIKNDITSIDKELLKYLDVDDSILVERDQILSSLKQISKNQKNLEKDVTSAIKTEKKMEKTYYDKFSGLLENLQKRVNQKFQDSQVKSYCNLELTGNFEDLGVNIKAATSKEQLKIFTALSGGQVSLISICLILSLQEIKPSPLCLLDEPGMFLDEKNSEVAYQLIKATLEQNPIQLLMFLPKSSNSLFLLAEKLIGIARVGKNEISSVFKPKIVKKKEI
ncbi:MAG: AAA family ATPase [Candidatus Thorarchaeota archaeon]